MGLWILCGSLLGARLGFILSHFRYFSANPGEIVKLHAGGLDWFGALIGAILFSILASIVLHLNILTTLDLYSVMLLPLASAGWLGCWTAGTAYGKALTKGTWWGVMMQDESGVFSLRVPLQPVAALSLIVLIILVERLARGKAEGFLYSSMGTVFSLHCLLFSFLRADPSLTFLRLRLDTLLSMISSIIFVILVIIHLRRGSKKDKIKEQDLTDEVVA